MTILEVKNLSYERGDQLLFENIAFTLDHGEILQIKGSNGSGKTSLLRVLSGLAPMSVGQIHWMGNSIEMERQRFYRDLIYIGHQLGLKSALTAKENLTYLVLNSGQSCKMSIDQALAKVSLQHYMHQLLQHLSAGEKRRVALAKLALLNAKLWILDEPFTALDTLGIEFICQLISEHIAIGGMVIVTSHQKIPLRCNIKELSL